MIETKCIECGSVYLKLARSKSKRCCRCRPAIKSERCLKVEVAPNAIQSLHALEQYFSTDELVCLICGQPSKGLGQHVSHAHGLSAREYKLKYGLPITYGLVGKATREKLSACGEATNIKMSADGHMNLIAARQARGKTRVHWPEYMRKEHANKMVESDLHPSNAEGFETLVCVHCGDDVQVDAKIAFARQCRTLCESCKGEKNEVQSRG